MLVPDLPPATTPKRRTLSLADMPTLMAAAEADQRGTGLRALPTSTSKDEFSIELVAEVLYPVLDQFIDGVLETLSAMRAGDATPLAGAFGHNLRTAIAAAVGEFTRAAAEGSADSTADLGIFAELGRKHALVGYPLEDLHWLYRVGAIACWREATGLYAAGRFSDEVLARVGELIFTLSHTLAEAAVEGYTSEAARASTLSQARRHEFLRRLLTGSDPVSEEDLEAAAAEFGWQLPDRVVVAVAVVDPDARGARHSFGVHALVEASVGEHHVGLLPVAAAEDPECVGTPPSSGMGRVAIGPAVPFTAARTSYERGQRLLDLADLGVVPAAPVLRATEHWLLLLLDREPELVADVVERRLGGLLELSERRRLPMLETLTAWLSRPGQITAIADELHVHAQTVRYRLDRLRELVGPAIDDPDERLELALATLAYRRGAR